MTKTNSEHQGKYARHSHKCESNEFMDQIVNLIDEKVKEATFGHKGGIDMEGRGSGTN